MITTQNYSAYTGEDHTTWKTLHNRQLEENFPFSASEYRKGFDLLDIEADKVANITELSKKLEATSGWTLIPVTGLIPTRDFFFMLINKKYPVTVPVRKPHELDFSELPDIFHDVYGHIPLLTNERFYRFLTEFSIIALKYVDNEEAVEYLGRLYWYTFEMGIILEENEMRPYGGAVLTSRSEIENVKSDKIPKHPFDTRHIFKTPYNPYKLQEQYFVINSFDDLFDTLMTLERDLMETLDLKPEDLQLSTAINMSLNRNLAGDYNNVIRFLNDIQFKYPDAISFAAGQPDERFFDLEKNLGKYDRYISYLQDQNPLEREVQVNRLGQYGKTAGMINEVLAKYLAKDENIHVKPEDILVTVGAQEAFAITVSTICNRDEDVVLLEDPSYVDVSGYARLFGYKTDAVPTDNSGIDLKKLEDKIIETKKRGYNVKLLYVIPDYQNPSGCCMPVENRLKLLDLAAKHNFLIIEDSVYNSYTYEQKKQPTLKSLDKLHRVIYVTSFSKHLFPGLRIGLMAVDQQIMSWFGETIPLTKEMVKVKALLTNNTSTVAQSILAGILIDNDYTLQEYNKPKYEAYAKKRNRIFQAMDKYIGNVQEEWARQISWNRPNGGFFIKMEVPFEVNDEVLMDCVKNYGVIFCPMNYFYLNAGDGMNEIRLTFSNLSLQEIDAGIRNFAAFLKDKVTKYADGVEDSATVRL